MQNKAKQKTDQKADEPADTLHWADQTAAKIISEKGDKKKYTVASGITPSGTVHIGNFREIITTELVARSLRRLGKKVRFIYSWDDYDVLRKVPKNMPKPEFLEKFLRMPIVDTPDTSDEKSGKSYARKNEEAVENIIPKVGINPEFIYQHKMYRACKYAEQMHHAILMRQKIIDILNKCRKEPLDEDWMPVSVFCGQCKKDTTKITDYDKNNSISYKCASCGHEDSFDIRKKGFAKLKWRIDWPMRWGYEDVDFEPGGKDHSTVGGSRDTGAQIIKEVWDKEPPVYLMYDFIRIKGGSGKISSSSGEVVDLYEVLEIYEPMMVRWLFAGTRPNAEFAISFDADAIKLYEDFDKCERIYYGEEKAKNEKEDTNQRRIYELSAVDEDLGRLPEKIPYQPSFRHLCNVILMNGMDAEKSISFYEKQLKDEFDRQRLKTRAVCAVNWLKKYAPDEFKFVIQDEVADETRNKLSGEQKKALKDIAAVLKKRQDWNDEKLHEEFYIIMQNNRLDIKDFFKAAYNVLINKDRGPKLAAFVLEIKEKAIKLFEQV